MTARVATRAARAAIRGSNGECSVYVRGLNWRTGRAELKQHFENFGKTNRIFVMMNNYTGLSTGQAIVNFQQYDSLSAALENKNQVIDGENVSVIASARTASVLEEMVSQDIGFAPSEVEAAPSDVDAVLSEVDATSSEVEAAPSEVKADPASSEVDAPSEKD